MASVPEVRETYQEKVAVFARDLSRHDPEGEPFWALVASIFPNPRWFGTGTNGLCPDLVVQAIGAFNAAPEGTARRHDYWPWQEETLRNVGEFIGADADEVGLVENATVAMNYIANGLRVPYGSKAVVTDFEHPGGFKPWERTDPKTDQPLYQVIRANLPIEGATAETITEAVLAAIAPDTAAVMFSHIDRYRGFLLPAGEIVARIRVKAPNAFIVIDGAQSVGSIPVNVHRLGCDAYVTGFHKWAFGPKGTGCVYVRKDRLNRVASTLAHSRQEWDGVNARLAFSSTVNWGVRFATEVALDLQRAIGREAVARRTLVLCDRFLAKISDLQGLKQYSPTEHTSRSAIVTVAFDGPPDVYTRLEARAHAAGILAWADSVPDRGTTFRVPIHVYNTPQAIDELAKVVRETIGGRR